jgi:hypothetical protein
MVMSGCIVNDFSLTLSRGGNGVIDATFNGWGNRHRIVDGALAENATGSLSSGEQALTTEPLVNFKSCHLFVGTGLETGAGPTSLSTTGYDLAGQVDITTILNSITIGGSNGMSAENAARASGYGLINDFSRGDRRYTLELNLRKDTSVWDINARIISDAQRALELQFVGPFLTANYRYSMHLFLPLFQILRAPEDNESPISRALTTEVMQDANGDSMIAYVQSGISVGYNSTKA